MKFSQLAIYINEIEQTSSRLKMTHLLAELFKKLHASEIDKTIYLLQGRVVPLYEKTEFGMAEKMLIKSVTTALHLEKKYFENEYKKIGDIGKTVEHFKKTYKSLEEKDLDIKEVYEALLEVAKKSGTGSQDAKGSIIGHLVSQLDPLSCRYLIRIPVGTLRLGFSDMTVLDAFSWMVKGDKSLRAAFEKVYHVRPDLGYLGKIIKEKGEKIGKIQPRLFTPIIMMRAERLSSAKEILEKIGKCSVEPKYDGFRLQIHYSKLKHEARLYSRNLEEVSFMYPDIIAGIKKEVKARELICEGEAIGYDPNTGNFLPFQETVQRKRKYGIDEKTKEIPLKLFLFELLYLDGKSFLDVPFVERRKALVKSIKPSVNLYRDTVFVASDEVTDDQKKLNLMFEDALSKGLEGIVAKKLSGIYQPGARGWNWIKFKRSYSAKIKDTIDCLIMGYDYGKGKRTGFGIGAFLAGVYDQKRDFFVTVAKVGTGLSDEEWKELKKRGEKYKTDKKPGLFDVDRAMEVDVWMKPGIVVEIKADEITKSPVHTAGRKMKASKSGSALNIDVPGYALRFPRLEQFRDDKRPEETTTLVELEELYKNQGI